MDIERKQTTPRELPISKLSRYPPTPPESEGDFTSSNSSRSGSISISNDIGSSEYDEATFTFPLAPPTVNPTKTLDIDLDTPDAHVPRDPRLIRLTGVHPFNVEAPLSDLYNSGFLTPPELFYVRNHGAVPEVLDEDIPQWDVTVEGLVENNLTLSFPQLSTTELFPQYTLPITLVCAGNRRKEQNQVRKSQGFSWGAAGVSTSLFTGPMLSDILAMAKPLTRRGARYVCFEGADKLPNGYYGTSVKLSWVMDPHKGIMLAHKMNGEMLRPDHGKPIRVVVPGMIGGRSVKWLKRIIITDAPSTNWYHIYDNRVLPTMVTPEMAKGEEGKKWWTDERYAIYDLNVNSAVAYPAHEEKVEMAVTEEEEKTYNVRGYAYGGGGRRISRVEVSLDKGTTWRLASISYPEDKYRELHIPENLPLYGGKLDMTWRDSSFCWCFWNLEIPHTDLLDSCVSDIVVRAMDEGMNLQPKDMYWSVLGMMNNPWFRVAVHKETSSESGKTIVRFEHPTQPALQPGGWMERVKKAGGDLMDGNWGEVSPNATGPALTPKPKEKKPEIKMVNDSVNRIIEIDEFRAHATKENGVWFVVEGEVYDGTEFLDEHPGGATSIVSAGGTDCTEEFVAIHSETAKAMMPKYHVGTLSPTAQKALKESSSVSSLSSEPRPEFLSPRDWLSSTLISKTSISHDTRVFTFSLEHPTQKLGLPVGQHLMIKLKLKENGETVIRAYTPISDSDIEQGIFRLLVKIYADEGVDGKRGGVMSVALDKLQLGEAVSIKGPVGKFEYLVPSSKNILPLPIPTTASPSPHPNSNVILSGDRRNVTSFLMVCAGTGITPIYQVLRAVIAMNHASPSKVSCYILYGNRTEDDILCKPELDALLKLAADGSDGGKGKNIKMVHTLTSPSESWEGTRGRICNKMLGEGVEWLKSQDVETGEGGREGMMVLACGPRGLEEGVKGWVGEFGLEGRLCIF